MNVEVEAMSAETLSLVSALAHEMLVSAQHIAQLEEALKQESETFRTLEQVRLPDAMGELGVVQLKLASGATITVKPEYHASIPKAKRDDAMQWLKDNEFGDLIKNKVTIEFGKGQEEDAVDVAQALRARFQELPVVNEETIHASTLKSLVKTEFESGTPLPEELFGVHIINRAVIKGA